MCFSNELRNGWKKAIPLTFAHGFIFALRAADVHQPLRLPGQEVQQFDTGASGLNLMSYNGARWYVARWGRYTQSDPVDDPSWDTFRYAEQNPLRFTDSTGERSKLPYGHPDCVRLREAIQNVFNDINERVGEHFEDQLGLPERAPGDLQKPSLSRFGHRMLITKDKALLAKKRALYDAMCDDPSGPLSCPAKLPIRSRKLIFIPDDGDAALPSYMFWPSIPQTGRPVPVRPAVRLPVRIPIRILPGVL